jgi:ParB family chromosome partitioning protein
MAKRKRLTPANPEYLPSREGGLETKSIFPKTSGSMGSAPISAVAGDAAATAALAELSAEMTNARATGRMVLDVPLEQIDAGHLVRDRAHVDEDDMESLIESLSQRGQQTPIEVVQLEGQRYGLISGWRRLEALKRLKAETVLAFLRNPQDGADAYISMVEENEIRADLSFYERARIVVQATAQGVFASEKHALKALFKSSPRARRSKIGSFIPVVRALDGRLQYPHRLTEKNGLTLAKALQADETAADKVTKILLGGSPDAQSEWSKIQRAIKPKTLGSAKLETDYAEVAPGVQMLSPRSGEIVLSGVNVTPEFERRLLHWLRKVAR